MGTLPEKIPLSAFGPSLMAFVACLTGRFHLSKRETITLIKDLYDIDLSEGSIINVEEKVSKALESVYGKIYRYVIEGDLCRYFDETSWRNKGKTALCLDRNYQKCSLLSHRSSSEQGSLVQNDWKNLQIVQR